VGAAIEIENVSKHFRLYHEKPDSLKERVIKFGRLPHEEFWALRDISLDIQAGETLGLLGHNGSGKSTLLKCIAGILRPTTGSIRSSGRIAALLELGAGFHTELTGRENVYMNGSILGLSKREVDRIFDDIVAFSELEPFIDSQVKHFSSGMYMRLAFAVAINVEPEILLIDEVLAVGDEAFQRKCIERIKNFQKEGRTIVFVTHAADLVRTICDKAAVLDKGELLTHSTPGEAVLVFRDALLQRGIDLGIAADPEPSTVSRAVRITGVELHYPDPARKFLVSGEPLEITLGYEASRRTEDIVFAFNIHDQLGNLVLGTNSEMLGLQIDAVEGRGTLHLEMEHVPLLEGVFALSFGIHSRDVGIQYDHRAEKDHLEVMNPGRSVGLVSIPTRVSISHEQEPQRSRAE
jgi:ABC-2 type transport system ATP-binding protein